MGTPSSSSQKLIDFVVGKGVELPAADEDAFDAIIERVLGNVAFMFRNVSAPTLGSNGHVLFWPEELTQYQGSRVFELYEIARTDDTLVYFVAYPIQVIRVQAVVGFEGRLVAQDCMEFGRRALYRELLASGDQDPIFTVLRSVEHLIFQCRNRVQKTERELTRKLERNQQFIDRYTSAVEPK